MPAFVPADLAAMADYFLGEWIFSRTIWEASENPKLRRQVN